MKKLIKLFFLFAIISTFCISTQVRAEEPRVKIMFLDTLYGAAIGAAIGGIVILNDNDNWKEKLTLGITLGAIGGLAFGVIEGSNFLTNHIPTRPLIALYETPAGQKYTAFHLDVMSLYF